MAAPVPAAPEALRTLVRSAARVQTPSARDPASTPVDPVNVRVRVLVPSPDTATVAQQCEIFGKAHVGNRHTSTRFCVSIEQAPGPVPGGFSDFNR